jgi:hypothetical protein
MFSSSVPAPGVDPARRGASPVVVERENRSFCGSRGKGIQPRGGLHCSGRWRYSQLSFSKASELVRDGAHTPHR